MGVRVSHMVHWVEVARLQGVDGGGYRDVLRRAVLVQNGARVRVRVDTGRLRGSIDITAPVYRGLLAAGARIGSNVEYAPYVGTHACKECWGAYLTEALEDARG